MFLVKATPARRLDPLEADAALVSKAMLRAADILQIPAVALAEIIGTSEATVSRVRNQRTTLSLASKEGELALLFLRMFRSLDALVGGNEVHARSWLREPNRHLGDAPLARLKSVQGLVEVVSYLDALRGPI